MKTRSTEWSPGLSEAEQAELLAIAGQTLAACCNGREVDLESFALTPALRLRLATFVTLKLHGLLRGCIGSLEAEAPLYRSVHENTVRAACHDPRFPPVGVAELPLLALSVSILSPSEPIANAAGFLPGAHGVILTCRGRRAVFLPEVASEQGWTREQTLGALSEKAGLPREAWRQARLAVFHTVVLQRS